MLFEETPRSKFAKKYIPPMDVLAEETASQYASTVRGSTVTHNLHQSRLISGAMPEYMMSLREASHRTQVEVIYEQPVELIVAETPDLKSLII